MHAYKDTISTLRYIRQDKITFHSSPFHSSPLQLTYIHYMIPLSQLYLFLRTCQGSKRRMCHGLSRHLACPCAGKRELSSSDFTATGFQGKKTLRGWQYLPQLVTQKSVLRQEWPSSPLTFQPDMFLSVMVRATGCNHHSQCASDWKSTENHIVPGLFSQGWCLLFHSPWESTGASYNTARELN